MISLAAFERYLAGPEAPPACPRERDFHALWHARGLDAMAPIDAAVTGGLLADRLAWVFTAGYQATLRNAFGQLPAGGWAAFAATEDVADPAAHPPVTLTEGQAGLVLCGCKSWVGHSRLVGHLVVTVNDPGGDKRRARGVLLPATRVGVRLTHRERPAFLPSMSQGYARFDDVVVAPDEVFGFEPIRQFGRTEAKFVMLAATAFMFARLPAGGGAADHALATAAALAALIGEAETSRQVYGAIEREYQRVVAAFEREADTGAVAEYATDRRLFEMYSARIQRRVGYARAEAGLD
ncbi:MAG: hypothetical protein ACU85V_05295 [Gammaproteobacteria bacterium]